MKERVRELLREPGALAENEVKDLLTAYKIPTTHYYVVSSEKDLAGLHVTYPVALKVCSRRILHKTDVGGVKLGITGPDDLRAALTEFRRKFPGERFLVDEMVQPGVEIIVGLAQDPSFGLTVMCGIGGIFTELYKDVTFRVVPIDVLDAAEMVEEIRGKKLLEGFRNIKANKRLVVELLQRVSDLGEELMDSIDQMDLNPVFVYENSICVVDAKLIVKKKE